MSQKRNIFVAPFFLEEEDGEVSIQLNGKEVSKDWFRKCRNVLNDFLEELSDEDIDQLNYINKNRKDI